jgi:hypothetical protein
MTNRLKSSLFLLIALALFSVGCSKNDSVPSTPSYTVPETYTFKNVDSIPAKTLLSMLANMELVINQGNTSGNVVDAAKLKSMFSNQGRYFRDTTFSDQPLNLNSSSLNLKSNTFGASQVLIENIFDSVALASQSGQPASNGVAGVSTRKTLLSGGGMYWRQYFTKAMMGVLIGHLVTDVYLGDSLNSTASIEAKQHAWDQAFYLWCVPVNFPANRAGVKYWGSYTSQVDSGVVKPVVNLTGINANPTLMAAFLKGRAALENNDIATAKQQAAIIIPIFETIEAAAALHELNEAKAGVANGPAAVCGLLSESLGFWTALKFNPHKKISDADYQAVAAMYGTNFYNITVEQIDNIINKISSIYGWDSVKSFL